MLFDDSVPQLFYCCYCGGRSCDSLSLSVVYPFGSRRLHALDELFSQLVEAVSEVGKREEECRGMEDETDKMLARQGGPTRLQV